MIRAGRLSRYIEIEEQQGVDGGTGVVDLIWFFLIKLPARKVPQGAAEKIVGTEIINERTVVWSVRYRTDITPCMRVKDESGRIHRITSVQEGSGNREESLIVSVIEDPDRD